VPPTFIVVLAGVIALRLLVAGWDLATRPGRRRKIAAGRAGRWHRPATPGSGACRAGPGAAPACTPSPMPWPRPLRPPAPGSARIPHRESPAGSAADAIFTLLERDGLVGQSIDARLAAHADHGLQPRGWRAQVTTDEARRLPPGPDCFGRVTYLRCPQMPEGPGLSGARRGHGPPVPVRQQAPGVHGTRSFVLPDLAPGAIRELRDPGAADENGE